MPQALKEAAEPGFRAFPRRLWNQDSCLGGCTWKSDEIYFDWRREIGLPASAPLLSGGRASAVLADKGYDADYIVAEVLAMHAEPVIPPRGTRKETRGYDKFLYKKRNVIEKMFGKMKHFRSVATRYSKMAFSYLEFVQLAAILLWLK